MARRWAQQSELGRFLAQQAESLGIAVLPETPATRLLVQEGRVVGARTGDRGRGRNGERLANFEAGSDVVAMRTRAEREKSGDPRPSIEERYKSKDDYLDRVTKSANDLASKGYLIKEDIPRIVQQTGARWDWVMANAR